MNKRKKTTAIERNYEKWGEGNQCQDETVHAFVIFLSLVCTCARLRAGLLVSTTPFFQRSNTAHREKRSLVLMSARDCARYHTSASIRQLLPPLPVPVALFLSLARVLSSSLCQALDAPLQGLFFQILSPL